MALLQPNEPSPTTPPQGFALFALGFRPFFLLAVAAAVLLIPVWSAAFASALPIAPYYGGIAWHTHEMLFGYTLAVIAGFLLTAVRNWTAVDTPSGRPLMLLAGLWLAGRIVSLTELPGPLIAAVDLAFLPALAVAIGIPLLRAGQRHNYIFLGLLALLTAANLLLHLSALGWADTWRAGIELALGTIVLLIVVVGGRVVPFFIERGLPGTKPRQWRSLEQWALATVIGWLAARLLFPGTAAHIALAGAAASVHTVRVGGWLVRGIGSNPLLWVLVCGFAWLAAGFLLDAAAAAELLPISLATHAFTVGTIGVLTLGMMARVALGHTGRPMRSARSIGFAFLAINLAALARVIAPALSPSFTLGWLHLSALLWVAAFLPFLIVYAPILIRPRIDGRPG